MLNRFQSIQATSFRLLSMVFFAIGGIPAAQLDEEKLKSMYMAADLEAVKEYLESQGKTNLDKGDSVVYFKYRGIVACAENSSADCSGFLSKMVDMDEFSTIEDLYPSSRVNEVFLMLKVNKLEHDLRKYQNWRKYSSPNASAKKAGQPPAASDTEAVKGPVPPDNSQIAFMHHLESARGYAARKNFDKMINHLSIAKIYGKISAEQIMAYPEFQAYSGNKHFNDFVRINFAVKAP